MTKSRKKCVDAPKATPGPKGQYQGLRLQYLESRYNAYERAIALKTTREFWPEVCLGYWKRVEWRKRLNEETDPEHFANASVPEDHALTTEEQLDKANVISSTNKVCEKFYFKTIYWKLNYIAVDQIMVPKSQVRKQSHGEKPLWPMAGAVSQTNGPASEEEFDRTILYDA
jgi:hypothetical protein